ncbi:alpha-amylase family glycosyl hydrolase [Shigella flexneri]
MQFGGKARGWHAESEQYYLHLFAPEQANLNWENPAVRAELKKVCEFWADRGVDGLRLDVVNLISKKDQDFPNFRRRWASFTPWSARACVFTRDEPRRLHATRPDDGRRDVFHHTGKLPAYAAPMAADCR